MVNRNITVIGHDNRTATVYSLLLKDGYNIAAVTCREELQNACLTDIIILPIPYKDASGKIKGTDLFLSDISAKLSDTNIIILGRADNTFIDLASRMGFEYIDINEDKRFKILNAIPTAEAAVSIAMENTERTMWGRNVLVCGYGCIAKHLVMLLKGFGCNVTVAARKESDLYEAELLGSDTVNIESVAEKVPLQDVIFNTCPALVLDKNALGKVKKQCMIIDLASRPGGCDFDFARQNGINAKLYLSLPDVYAPKSSGENMYKIISSIIAEHA